jgi:hypothetical protein
MPYERAATLARESATADSERFKRRSPFRAQGTPIGADADAEAGDEASGTPAKIR